ncbi:MAG: hypothetical protein Q7U38_17100 [Methylobacter sp.]|nr:hypothetical protein [Methylobacter sp.]MDP2099245.1 hypothetical protein [Methylobacter sp.]MDP2426608.1 hypothetical protein [Methylobacter sp.]MDP3055426.1 hypothetical protein [Methylobacter sp.]MDP3364286.1 hypothetical protein [Methylobacter sp.]
MNIFSLQLKKLHDERFLKVRWGILAPPSKSGHYREVGGAKKVVTPSPSVKNYQQGRL